MKALVPIAVAGYGSPMANDRTRLTRDEQRTRLKEKARDLDHEVAERSVAEEAKLDAMVRKSIKDYGA
jgi:hypothetical protein